MCNSKGTRPSSSQQSPKRMKNDSGDSTPKQSEIDDFFRCIQQDLIERQENSQNLSNRDEVQRRSFIERTPDSPFKSSQDKSCESTEKVLERMVKSEFIPDSEPQTTLDSGIGGSPAAASNNEPDAGDQVSVASSCEEPSTSTSTPKTGERTKEKATKEKASNHLERIQEDYASIRKRIQPRPCDKFLPFDSSRPAYLLKEALNSHSLNEIAQLYTLNAKEKTICPYLLSKTGLLLIRKFIELRPEMEEELCNDLVDFVKQVRFLTAMPTAELFLDFLVFCYETGNQRLVEEFGNLDDHVIAYYHLSIKRLRQNFEMFRDLIAFMNFHKEFKEDQYDSERYERDEFKSKDFTHICLQLKKLITSPDYEQPLDHLLLCLVDLLILFKKLRKAKRLLFKFYECHPNNLNAVIYILKFNELHFKDPDVFRTFYNRLIQLDPSHQCLIDYLDHICSPVECLKILLCFVDYAINKDHLNAWQTIHDKLDSIESGSSEETAIKEFYETIFAGYWPTYQFTNLSIKISPENCELLFRKASVFHYFQPLQSAKFVAQVKLVLTITQCDKLELLNQLRF